MARSLRHPNVKPVRSVSVAAGIVSVALLLPLSVSAAEPAADPAARGETPMSQKGYDISARSDRSDAGFAHSIVSASMVLKNSAGRESTRAFSFKTLEKPNEQEGDKSLITFLSPKDVSGTSLLSHAQIVTPDNQWLYLPALKRVKRISTANKSGAFVGSEFAFEDFTTQELNKFTYNYLGTEELDGMMTDKIERFPRYSKSGYTRQVAWIDQSEFQTRRVDFYDRKDELLKTLYLEEYREYNGVWRSHRLRMENHQTGKSTQLLFETYDFTTPLEIKDFEKNVLRRIR